MIKQKDNQFINFEAIRLSQEINDPSVFQIYLKELYKDLSDRAESNKKIGISKITFWEFMKLPVFISEKLFSAMDKDNDNALNSNEFSEGLFKLYHGDFNETVEIIFNLLDFDKDGYIEKGDSKILLSHLPLKSENISKNEVQYKYQMESLNEIDEIINQTFGKNEKLNIKEFTSIVQKIKSDIFLQMLCFIYLNKPFNEQNLIAYQSFKRKSSNDTNERNSPISKSSENNKRSILIASPSRKSLLKPAGKFLKINLENNLETKDNLFDSDEDFNSDLNSNKEKLLNLNSSDNFELLLVRMDNTKLVANNNKVGDDLNEVIKNSKSVLDSPSVFLKREVNKKVSDFNLLENLKPLENVDSPKSNHITPTKKYSSSKNEITYEDWVYKITENNKLKKYFLSIVGKDIYYYKSDKKEELIGMHNLSGCFAKENVEKKIDGKKLFSFSIVFSSKTRNYYCSEKSEVKFWIQHLKSAIGYQSFFDFYEIVEDLGEGKFGMVKLGLHRKTQKNVAIKIIKKDAMTINDMELVRTEIDIMKLCKHPNVVRLLDHFENAEYIFIVMEYLSGGDLSDYFTKYDYKFDEVTCAKTMYQIASGIKYIHQFGIVHRDLKPENIMLSNNSQNPLIKIMDFGLSKFLGPLEKACDGFGTLSFVAPEVLIRQPYSIQIDIWSIGVILYYMLSGILPFDDESDNEEIIAKMTVFNEIQFPSKHFKNRSPQVQDLISKSLIKDPLKRISIEEFLRHEWIIKHNQF